MSTDEKKYLNHIKNQFIVTTDGWKTQKIIKDGLNLEEFSLEKDEDKAFKAKLRANISEENAELILLELEKIRSMLKKKDSDTKKDGYGHAFEVFAVATLHNGDYADIIDKNIVHGDEDGKVDAVFWTNEEVFFYQIKMGRVYEDTISKMKSNIKSFIMKKKQGPHSSHLIKYLKNVKDIIRSNRYKHYKTISSNELKNSSNETPNAIFKKFLLQRLVPQEKNNLELTIPLEPREDIPNSNISNISICESKNYFIFLSAYDLIVCIEEMNGVDKGQKIYKMFYDNVRGKLPTNKKMESTIDEKPDSFSLYNNGISITGEVDYPDDDAILHIKNPTIVNGQQTITTLMEHKNKAKLNKVYVPIFVKNVDDAKEKSSIALFNNTQKNIKAIDLLSLNSEIRDMQVKLMGENFHEGINDNQFYLDIYSQGRTEYKKLANKLFGKYRQVKLSEFTKLYYSIENIKDIGRWKNSINTMVEQKIQKKGDKLSLDTEKARKVCKSIVAHKKLVDKTEDKEMKSRLRVGDLMMQYFLYKTENDEDKAYDLKYHVDKLYDEKPADEKPKSLKDLYRYKDLHEYISYALKKEDMIK